MMIAIASMQHDLIGHVVIEASESSEIKTVERRVSRTRTLGPEGAVVNDSGFFDQDRTFIVVWRVLSDAQYASVSRLVRIRSKMHMVTSEGVFIVHPESLSMSGKDATLRVLVMGNLAILDESE